MPKTKLPRPSRFQSYAYRILLVENGAPYLDLGKGSVRNLLVFRPESDVALVPLGSASKTLVGPRTKAPPSETRGFFCMGELSVFGATVDFKAALLDSWGRHFRGLLNFVFGASATRKSGGREIRRGAGFVVGKA